MLKSEVIKIITHDELSIKKLVLMRYLIEMDVTKDLPYKSNCLMFIQSVKSLPEVFETITFLYEISDPKVTKLNHQRIIIYIDDSLYYELKLDDDLEFFFNISRLFHELSEYVESFEELTTNKLLNKTLERYKK